MMALKNPNLWSVYRMSMSLDGETIFVVRRTARYTHIYGTGESVIINGEAALSISKAKDDIEKATALFATFDQPWMICTSNLEQSREIQLLETVLEDIGDRIVTLKSDLPSTWDEETLDTLAATRDTLKSIARDLQRQAFEKYEDSWKDVGTKCRDLMGQISREAAQFDEAWGARLACARKQHIVKSGPQFPASNLSV